MTAAIVIRDVFRQARASGLTAALAGLVVSASFACAVWPINSGNSAAVAQFQFILAGLAGDTAGVLLALVWTAGFLPAFLDAHAISVLLAKPVSRRMLFLSRWLGVIIYVSVFAVVFVAATWLALGVNTGAWPPSFWLCAPLMIAHFVVFYAFSALLAVAVRSTTLCMVGSLAFWLLCWGMNYGRHALAGIRIQEATPGLGRLVEWCYWVLPKPADFSLILVDALGAHSVATPGVAFSAVQSAGLFDPAGAVLSSLATGLVFLLVAVGEFVHDEY